MKTCNYFNDAYETARLRAFIRDNDIIFQIGVEPKYYPAYKEIVISQPAIKLPVPKTHLIEIEWTYYISYEKYHGTYRYWKVRL